jgi:glycosyltransferase involved in cell wall biosynthesis
MSILNRPQSEKLLSRQDFDIFHPTYYDTYFLKYIDDKPFVLTIHDMIHEIYPWYFPTEDRTSANKKLLAQKAARIIAVSENTKNDIVRFLGVDEEKITVIYHGTSLSKFPVNQRFELPVPQRYILFVGKRSRYKNFEFFIQAISPLLSEDKDLNVVCAGGKGFADFERCLFEELCLEDRIHRLEVGDEALAFLYRNALAFVFPSLYEGFGIPVLEALSCGCPAILSNTSALAEAGGEAVVYFDPKSEISIRKAVGDVIFNEDVRRNLRAKGFKQVERFSWKETAHRTAAVYRSIV